MEYEYEVTLACDPSLTAFGYAVIGEISRKKKAGSLVLLELGVIKTKSRPLAVPRKVKTTKKNGTVITPAIPRPAANEWDTQRLEQIASTLLEVIQRRRVTRIVWEDPCGSKDYHANKALSQVKGIMVGMITALGLEHSYHRAREIKYILTGDYDAEKVDIQDVVESKFPEFQKILKQYRLSKLPEIEATADAVAVFIADSLSNQP